VSSRTVPSAANFDPKMVTMALGAIALTTGELSPALAIPPAEICGAVGDTAGVAVTVNATLGPPATDAVMVMGPAVAPSVAFAVAVPLLMVMEGEGVRTAAPAGFTV
jgi:hypothetical protein